MLGGPRCTRALSGSKLKVSIIDGWLKKVRMQTAVRAVSGGNPEGRHVRGSCIAREGGGHLVGAPEELDQCRRTRPGPGSDVF